MNPAEVDLPGARESRSAGVTVRRAGLDLRSLFGLLFVSILYFADVMWRAIRKPFWFDELFTVYLCRLPSLHATLSAVQHGADFNPPLFYFLTRAANAVLGEGRIATRLPGMIGVWLFCICLFLFVVRRCGRLAGLVAGIFPLCTLVQFYAYEARPHGILLGWLGVALLGWQRMMEDRARLGWRLLFFISLAGAVATHVYALFILLPFAAVEVNSFIRKRSVHYDVIAAVVISGALAVLLYLPIIRVYQAIKPTDVLRPAFLIATTIDFTQQMIGGGLFVLIAVVAVSAFAFVPSSKRGIDSQADRLAGTELVLAACFIVLPLAGMMGAIATHVFFFYRYFLCCTAGLAILAGYAMARLRIYPGMQQMIAAGMLIFMMVDLGSVALNSLRGWNDRLVESNTRTTFRPLSDDALMHDPGMVELQKDLPILDVDGFKYIYLYRYASPDIVRRLYYGSPLQGDFGLAVYRRLADGANLDLKTTLFSTFFLTHEHFYVLNNDVSMCKYCMRYFVQSGYSLRSVTNTAEGDFFEFKR